MTTVFSAKDLLAMKDMLANNKNLLEMKDMLMTTVGSIAVAKILKSPTLIKGIAGGAAVVVTGYAVMKFSESKQGRKLRKRIATAIRDYAQSTVDTMETVQELEEVARV